MLCRPVFAKKVNLDGFWAHFGPFWRHFRLLEAEFLLYVLDGDMLVLLQLLFAAFFAVFIALAVSLKSYVLTDIVCRAYPYPLRSALIQSAPQES